MNSPFTNLNFLNPIPVNTLNLRLKKMIWEKILQQMNPFLTMIQNLNKSKEMPEINFFSNVEMLLKLSTKKSKRKGQKNNVNKKNFKDM